jgi:hypothetical protein
MNYNVVYRPAAKRRLCKQRPLLGNARNIHVRNKRTTGLCNPFLSVGSVNTPTIIGVLSGTVFSIRSLQSGCKEEFNQCRGGIEYLHHSPASRSMRQKRKSWIWDSQIWSRVPRDSDPRMTSLARTSRNCQRQTRPLVRESAPHQQTCNCLTVILIRSLAPDGCFIPRQTGRLIFGRLRFRLRISQSSCAVPSEQLVESWALQGRLKRWRNKSRCGVLPSWQRSDDESWRTSTVKIRYQKTSSENIAGESPLLEAAT